MRREAFLVLALAAATPAISASFDLPGRVHPDPAQPHPGFKPHQLSFATPQDGIARSEFRSEPFYAVVLKTTAKCADTEAERLRIQALFPSRRVFGVRFGCDDPEENITYTNVDAKFGFLALYAGATEQEGREILRKVQAAGTFPGANVRRIQAVLVYP